MKTEIIAHRGIKTHWAPENTLHAIAGAWKRNISAEIDIRLTKDGRIAVIHDSNTKRLLRKNWQVSKTPLKRLASRKIVDSNKTISALGQILKRFPKGNSRLFIEIKCGDAILPVLKNCLLRFPDKLDQIAIVSFHLNMLAKCVDELPKTKLYWTGPKVRDHRGIPISGFLCRWISEESVKVAHEQGHEIYAWTINSYDRAQCLINWGVDGIITDRALQILEFLKRRIRL